ncbi:MAG: hypothetical protein PVI37_02665 [Gammaproteobacteria bacterium]
MAKTGNLRDLGDSAPDMHNGACHELAAVIAFFRQADQLAREGRGATPIRGWSTSR